MTSQKQTGNQINKIIEKSCQYYILIYICTPKNKPYQDIIICIGH